MTAREMWADFIETFGTIAISVVVFYLVVVENYFDLAEKMVKFAMTLSVFSLPLIISARINKSKIRFHYRRDSLEKTIAVASQADIVMDRFIVALIVILLAVIPLYYGEFEFEDFVQSLVSFVLLFAWHLFFFRKQAGYGEDILITRKVYLLDKIFIKAMPVLLLLLVLANGSFDEIDIMQSALMFVVLLAWRWQFFRMLKV